MTYTEEQKKLIAVYGTCPVCQAPRDIHTITTYDDDGKLRYHRVLVCTGPGHHDQDAA